MLKKINFWIDGIAEIKVHVFSSILVIKCRVLASCNSKIIGYVRDGE